MKIDPRDIALCLDDDLDGPPPHPTSAPIVQTSLFSFETLDSLAEAFHSESRTTIYSRGQNPTVEALETKLAKLERGEACKAFGSGMAAISAAFLGLLQAGDHVVFLNQTYGPTLALARLLRRFGIEHDLVLDLDPASVEQALRPETRLIWVESPGTMLFRVVDLAAIAALAKTRGILSAIDNTWATPLLQKPLDLGFDLVMHTATKYIGGHSDVVGGALITTRERMDKIFKSSYLLVGGILGPWDAWLLLRGLRTLPARLREQGAAALEIGRRLQEHPGVDRVFHPELTDDAELSRRQTTGSSGTFSFTPKKAHWDDVCRLVDGLERFRIGVSWGGVESLVIAHKRISESSLRRAGLPRGVIRLSIGLEGVEPLWDDLARALDAAL